MLEEVVNEMVLCFKFGCCFVGVEFSSDLDIPLSPPTFSLDIVMWCFEAAILCFYFLFSLLLNAIVICLHLYFHVCV